MLTKGFFSLSWIVLFFLAIEVVAANTGEYMHGEVIVKLKDSSYAIGNNIEAINSASSNSFGSRVFDSKVISEMQSKYSATFEKIGLELDEVGSTAMITSAVESFNNRGLERILLLKMPSDTDINQVVSDLKNNADVEYAEPNYIVHIDAMPNDPFFNALYGLHNKGQNGGDVDADIDAPEAWDTTFGSNDVVIAVIDSGVDYTHSDLAENMWTNKNEIPNNGVDDDANGFVDDVWGWDFKNNDNNPFDDNGHGTHVAGTIGAVGNNSLGIAGVNWNVKIMPLKFLSSSGFGTNADAVRAIQYATLMGVDVMSNSWGGTTYSQALKDAIQAANDAGVLFVVAAGNYNNNNDASPFYPASYDIPNIISVAATDRNDQKASFSSYGLKSVDLGAPGVDIYSTVPNGSCSICDSSGYGYLSGTSMATPHVSGVAGLIKAKFPKITSDAIKARILDNVDEIPSLLGITVTGGRLNANKSLEIDETPPDGITDLASINQTPDSIVLMWTAPGDDGNIGLAKSYDVRYSNFEINELNWDTTIKANNLTKPKMAGSSEIFTIYGLFPNTTYFFAVKSIDNVGNPSSLSNVISASTTMGSWDIVMSNVLGNATAVEPGKSFYLVNAVKNQGSYDAGTFNINFHLSIDTIFGGLDDIPFALQRLISSLSAGQTSIANSLLTIPSAAPLGNYYICAFADSNNSIIEINESNNALCTNSTIQVTKPDLAVTNLSSNKNSTKGGDNISVAAIVQNQANVSAGSSSMKFVLSMNDIYGDIDDINLYPMQSVGSLAAGASIQSITNLLIPANIKGNSYHLCAKIDYLGNVSEKDENNNALCSNYNIDINKPDLTIQQLSTKTIYTAPGKILNLSNTAKNQGSSPSDKFSVSYHLSLDKVYGGLDDIAFTANRTVSSLGVGANSTSSTPLTIPLTTQLGYYFICAIADSNNSINELNELNNAACTDSAIQVTKADFLTKPDLVMTYINGPSIAKRGAYIYIKNTVSNQGFASSGSFYVGIYLSADANINTSDRFLRSRLVSGLSAGSNNSANTSVYIPTTLPIGTYYIGAVADSYKSVTEINETNNALAGNKVAIQ